MYNNLLQWWEFRASNKFITTNNTVLKLIDGSQKKKKKLFINLN